jgi:uncharacterized protein (TIGR03435 family)
MAFRIAIQSVLLLMFSLSAAPQTADASLSFEVASVKPAVNPGPPPANALAAAAAGLPSMHGGPGSEDPERFSCLNAKLAFIVLQAYDLQRFQIVGPDWIDTDRFDILAKVPPGATKKQFQLMLQHLLTQRFGMTAHREMRVTPVYALVVGKGGHKLQASESADEPSLKQIYPDFKHLPTPGQLTPRHVVFRNMTMGDLSDRLSHIAKDSIDRKVLDDTRIAGAYNFELQWFSPYVVARSGGQTIFEGVEKQLGLKLEPRKAPVETLVIDKVLRIPTEN